MDVLVIELCQTILMVFMDDHNEAVEPDYINGVWDH